MSYKMFDIFDDACVKAHHSADGEYFDLDDFCSYLRGLDHTHERAVLDMAAKIIKSQCYDDESNFLKTVVKMLTFDREVCIIESDQNSLTMAGYLPKRVTLAISGEDDL